MAAQEKQYHEELKMEITASKDVVAPVVTEDEESVPDAMQIAQENADMSTVLMSRKKRKLYEAMKVRTIHILPFILFSLIVSIGLLISGNCIESILELADSWF